MTELCHGRGQALVGRDRGVWARLGDGGGTAVGVDIAMVEWGATQSGHKKPRTELN